MELYDMMQIWAEAGERPHEVFIEEGIFHDFMDMLALQNIVIDDDYIFRGTRRHEELSIGDILKYEKPTSWSTQEKIATFFIDECVNKVLLILKNCKLVGSINEANYGCGHKEDEIVLAPRDLKVVDKQIKGDVVYLYVI